MKFIYIFFTVVTLSVTAYSRDLIWRAIDSPITVNHDETTLYVGDRLIIEPGVVVTTGTTVNGFARIRVWGGQILAQGTPQNPIIFNSLYIQSWTNWESASGEFENVVFNGGIGLTTRGHFTIRNCSFVDSELDARDSHYDFDITHNAFVRSTLRLGTWDNSTPLISVNVTENLLDQSILELPDFTGSAIDYNIASNSFLNASEVICYRGSSGPMFDDDITHNFWGTTNATTIEDLIYHDGDQTPGQIIPFFPFIPSLQNPPDKTVKFYENIDMLNDQDGDGLKGFQEIVSFNTSPKIKDSDNDGVEDGDEVNNGSNPALFEINDFKIESGTNLSWASGSGVVYQVQYTTDLNSNSWITSPFLISGNGSNTTINVDTAAPSRFYRVIRN